MRKVSALAVAAHGMFRLRSLFRAQGTELVVGSGGCVSGPALLAARSLGLRTAIIEPNAVPGLSNLLLKHVTHRAYCAFAEAAVAFPLAKRVITGTPLRADIDTAPPKRVVLVRDRPIRVVVTSGSRGAQFLATHVPALLGDLRGRGLQFDVFHQAGDVNVVALEQLYRQAGVSARVRPFIDDIWATYTWADVAITRAGASTLAELAMAALPALVVPLADAAADHQLANAKAYAATGAAIWATEAHWDVHQMTARMADLLLRFGVWERMAESARAHATPDAAAAIVRDCEALLA